MKLAGLRLRQRDGVTCGPTVAVVAGAILDPRRRTALTDPVWFSDEQVRVHADINRVWPRRWGTTPWGMVRALNIHGVRYRWRVARGRRDALADVWGAVAAGRPVAVLVGRTIPRHWVLIVGCRGVTFDFYEPTSGQVRTIRIDAVRRGEMSGVGFPWPFAYALPKECD
ncbi:Uncharacterised protein [Mycolicibacterium phlei]|jgi:hypothetical protein|uniref:Peptidase C39-like domain-containing protein n=2 Tax=Mycolicibacterium phlei TaxID=1771 RepID=A0A5N5V0A1_MYCPH|nr:hypothetical protein [Mycolicibacterium phlei]VEG07034.1 Uncharacterised protein [Mycobacteroides chelonae]AMO58902.1 hypothetical protein MPHLCCUG_00056 [Mycolicibacterium phlei]EID09398.1 hypothetical protein MPHLEI_25651 [Mycolicibacterium phlei RIVM601174]KAB7754567.1 hypothetical protein MPHL21000_15570 [Mycolicibacterium phlei DSM 43239 = CCUG 21000]KXW59942.1 hypothetical protein MPHL43070_07405 [Mycolicibacterium phlei DSM 43070]